MRAQRNARVGFFEHFTCHAVFDPFGVFEDAAGRLVGAIVLAADYEDPSVLAHDDADDGHRVVVGRGHGWILLGGIEALGEDDSGRVDHPSKGSSPP